MYWNLVTQFCVTTGETLDSTRHLVVITVYMHTYYTLKSSNLLLKLVALISIFFLVTSEINNGTHNTMKHMYTL